MYPNERDHNAYSNTIHISHSNRYKPPTKKYFNHIIGVGSCLTQCLGSTLVLSFHLISINLTNLCPSYDGSNDKSISGCQ